MKLAKHARNTATIMGLFHNVLILILFGGIVLLIYGAVFGNHRFDEEKVLQVIREDGSEYACIKKTSRGVFTPSVVVVATPAGNISYSVTSKNMTRQFSIERSKG